MAIPISVRFDPAAQATLDRLSQILALLATTISRTDKTMSALTDAADALKIEVAAAVAAIKDEATQISNLAAQLAAALASGNTAEAAAVTAELQTAATDLHTAIDAAHTPA